MRENNLAHPNNTNWYVMFSSYVLDRMYFYSTYNTFTRVISLIIITFAFCYLAVRLFYIWINFFNNLFHRKNRQSERKGENLKKLQSQISNSIEYLPSAREKRNIFFAKDTDYLKDLQLTNLRKQTFKKQQEKKETESKKNYKGNLFILSYLGDAEASGSDELIELSEIIINIAQPSDFVLLNLNSGGGYVCSYGHLAHALMRFREKGIKFHIFISEIAASGGYMLASTADHIVCSPWAIIGSIGVIVEQLNYNKLLKNWGVEVEQHTAGEEKRDITSFGENTEEKRKRLKESLSQTHEQFKNFVKARRPGVDIIKVGTGRTWSGEEAIILGLVDELHSSIDAYIEKMVNAYSLKTITLGTVQKAKESSSHAEQSLAHLFQTIKKQVAEFLRASQN